MRTLGEIFGPTFWKKIEKVQYEYINMNKKKKLKMYIL